MQSLSIFVEHQLYARHFKGYSMVSSAQNLTIKWKDERTSKSKTVRGNVVSPFVPAFNLCIAKGSSILNQISFGFEHGCSVWSYK